MSSMTRRKVPTMTQARQVRNAHLAELRSLPTYMASGIDADSHHINVYARSPNGIPDFYTHEPSGMRVPVVWKGRDIV